MILTESNGTETPSPRVRLGGARMAQVIVRNDKMDPAHLTMVQHADGRRVPLLALGADSFTLWQPVDPSYVRRHLNDVCEPTPEEFMSFKEFV